jgi:predicted transcriptional regulator
MRRFGELESAIMQHMWDRGAPGTVRELLDELRETRDIAYTTVMTVMDNLYRKGWLQREPQGRAFLYNVVASREEYVAQVMREALDGSGDPALALQHFVGSISRTEAAALRRALAKAEKRTKK